MIKRTKSTLRPKLESAPSASEPVTLPPVKSFDSPISPKRRINNYISNFTPKTLDSSVEIQTLHELCSQLLKGQEELRARLQKQELMIEELKAEKSSKTKSVEVCQGRKVESLVRRLPAFAPRGLQESGGFTFRPLETEKSKFPREIFSRKSRVRPGRLGNV